VLQVGCHSGKHAINRGWVPLFEEPAYEAGKVSFVEAFDLGMELHPRHPKVGRTDQPGIGPNNWPSTRSHTSQTSSASSFDAGKFRQDVYNLYERFSEASHLVYGLLEEALRVDPGTFSRSATEAQRSVMRLLKYPPPPPRGADVAPQRGADVAEEVGISAHTDFECFTFIHQSESGLQIKVRKANGTGTRASEGAWEWQWVDVPPLEGCFVVLLGDMLERWTNGLVEATPHRVARPANPGGAGRMSIVRFNGLDNDAVVQPLRGFVSEDRPSRYKPITQGEHMQRAAENAAKNNRELIASGKMPKSKYVPFPPDKTKTL